MVNTRKKSYVGSGDDSSHSSEMADSVTASATKRTTRRSVSNATATAQTPTREAATPVRRSRRLSNSSVESVNDTPIPKSATRRTTKNKNAESGDESSDLEVLVIKRRRGAKDVPALVPITEEKANDNLVSMEETNEAPLAEAKQEKEAVQDVEETANDKPQPKAPSPAEANEAPEIIDLRSPPPLVRVCREERSPEPSDGRVSANSDHSAESFKSIESPKNDANQTADNIHLELEASNDEEDKFEEDSRKDEAQPSKDVNSTEKVPVDNQVNVQDQKEMEVESSNSEPAKTETVMKVKVQEEVKSADNNQAKKPKKAASNVVDRLKKIAESNPAPKKTETNNNAAEKIQEKLPSGADILRNIPRGKYKSGRTWKQPKSNPRYLYQDKGRKMGLEKVTQLRQERQRIKEIEQRLKQEKQAHFDEIARRRELNKKREEENARRGEIVQVIRNPNKIKRMKKKQLKLIQKRDTTGM